MKKILVLVADYPNTDGGVALMFVHVRNKYYIQHGIDVTVLNFASKVDYEIDGIKVITLKTYENSNDKYDIAVSHAANLRNHYKFLKKYDYRFSRLIFFFHGHEILMINEVYPKPYSYMKKNNHLKNLIQNNYDKFKTSVWHKYFREVAYKADFIFVSKCLFKEFQKYVNLTSRDLLEHVYIIHNSVGQVFENNSYNYQEEKTYDFITIRNNLDSSVYCIDLVCELAEKYSEFKFLLIGKGMFFDYRKKPENMTWIGKYLTHNEIMAYINKAKCALMLSRRDTQGVMTCELSEYGIPVITSDIEVCKEICGDLNNVEMISNDISKSDLTSIYNRLKEGVPYEKQGKFSYKKTVCREEAIIKL